MRRRKPRTCTFRFRAPFEPRARHRAGRLRFHPEWSNASAARERALADSLRAVTAQAVEMQSRRRRDEAELRRVGEQVLRLRAEFDNFRKRAQREKEDLKKFANQALVEALVPVLDSFDQAQAALDAARNVEALTRGLAAIREQMENVLKAQGFEKVEAEGQVFDPNFHEALAVVKTDDHPENAVVDVVQSGYLLNGRLIRPARVRIAQKS